MIRTLPSSKAYKHGFRLFIFAYFFILFAPLVVTMVLAFNNSMYPSLPWEGFTLDWFFGDGPQKYGIFHDETNLRSLATSFRVAAAVTVISTFLGTCAAFLFEQENFRFKGVLYFLMIAPLVIPGVILGGILLTLLPELFRHGAGPVQTAIFGKILLDPEALRMLLFGLALVLVMLYRPAGLLPSTTRRREFKGDVNVVTGDVLKEGE